MHPFPVWIKNALGLSFKKHVLIEGQKIVQGRVWTRFFRVLEGPSAMKDAKTAKRPHFVHFTPQKRAKKGLLGILAS